MTELHEQEALTAALKREERGEIWYKKAAVAMENPIAKATFAVLAGRQRRFVETIQKIHQSLRRDSAFRNHKVVFPSLQPALIVVERLFRKVGGFGDKTSAASARDIFRAYLWAIGFEEKGAAIYARKAGTFDRSLLGDLFDFLRGQKGEHYQILDGTLTHLHCPESFFVETMKSPFSQKGE